ncbi:MAG: tetratricopeptide repeat protein [Gemmatimonadaceae bacterium]|nr:tetratricopeptide repeat protein [Gemmatimonadaceae bacterium]
MTFLRRVSDGVSRLLGGHPTARELGASRPDFVAEGMSLEKVNDLDGALTSYRLALRTSPDDPRILLNMAIVFTKSGRMDEAVRAYRKILESEPTHPGANYGIAFLLSKKGDVDAAIQHLETFLVAAPSGGDSARWIGHAQATLRTLRGEPAEAEPVAEAGESAAPVDTPVRLVSLRELLDEEDLVDDRLKATGTDGLRHGNDA